MDALALVSLSTFCHSINEIKFVEERNASSSLLLGFGLQVGFIYALRSAYSKTVQTN